MRRLPHLFQKKKKKENVDKAMQTGMTYSFSSSECNRSLLSKKGYLLYPGTLGEGTFSKVKKAFSRYHDNDVAIKIINREDAANDFLTRFLPRELNIILTLKHENICNYYEIMETGNKVYITMEYAPNGDLLEYILQNKFVEENLARKIFRQIVSGVKYLHQNKVLHRDLKCENILLTRENRVLISDFGFAKCVEDIQCLNQTYCGSSAYAPIEILNGMPYNGSSADVWSLGCILYIMVTGTMPFDDANKSCQIATMRNGPRFLKTKQKLSSGIQDFIKSILTPEVENRLTLEGIENNDWFLMDDTTTDNEATCVTPTKNEIVGNDERTIHSIFEPE